MDHKRFEELCRQANCQPVKKVTLSGGEILIADGYSDSHKEFPEPAYRTIWAVSQNDMDICQSLYIKMGSGDLQARINAAMKEAELWIKDNVAVGRYA